MSTTLKKTIKSKFPAAESDEFIAQIPKNKQCMQPKRAPVSLDDKEESGFPAKSYHLMSSAKKKKYETNGTENLVHGKLLEVMEAQSNGRKRLNDTLLKRLSELTEAMEADCEVQKKNNKKLQQLTDDILKCYQQSELSQEQKLKTLTEIQTEYQKRSEDMDSVHKKEASKLANDIENDIEQLEQKLIADTKRSGWDNLRKTIFEAMKSDFD